METKLNRTTKTTAPNKQDKHRQEEYKQEAIFSWASNIYCVNPYPNGITLSIHKNNVVSQASQIEDNPQIEAQAKFLSNSFHLRLRDLREHQIPTGKYFLYKDRYVEALEHNLYQLRKRNELSNTIFYFGMVIDPFLGFDKKFKTTMACMNLFEKYKPGLLIVQTRSPLVLSVLPTLKYLSESAMVSIPIETCLETMVARYSPGQPRISERLIAADGLRKQGIKVNLMASPILPYGDFQHDAWHFAEVLSIYADYITFGSLTNGSVIDEASLKNLPIARRLAADRQYMLLRPHSYSEVYKAVRAIAPEKLVSPFEKATKPEQMNLFAA